LIEYIKSLSPKPGQTETVQPTVPAAQPAAAGFQPGNR
jgi:hypothetical protein